MVDRQAQHGLAHQVKREGRRRHELGALGAVAQVLVRGIHALAAIAVQQPLARQALDDVGQLPGQVVGVVDAGVGTAHAKNRHQVGGVTGQQHALVAVVRQGQRIGFVDAGPDRVPGRGFAHHGQQALHARQHVLGGDGGVRVFAVLQLVVDTPDIVGLLVHQHGRSAVAVRVKVGQALGRAAAFHLDIDDDVAAFVAGALQLQTQRVAHKTAAPVGGHHPVGVHGVVALGGAHLQGGAVVTALDTGELVLPANLDQIRALFAGVEQELLDAVLRQVHHRRQLLVGVLGHQKVQHFLVAVVAAAARPGQAFVQKAGQRAQALHNLQAAARDADGAAAKADRVIGLQHHHGHAVVGQAQGRAIAHGAAADNDDRAARRIAPVLERGQGRIVGARLEWVGYEFESSRHHNLVKKLVLPSVGDAAPDRSIGACSGRVALFVARATIIGAALAKALWVFPRLGKALDAAATLPLPKTLRA